MHKYSFDRRTTYRTAKRGTTGFWNQTFLVLPMIKIIDNKTNGILNNNLISLEKERIFVTLLERDYPICIKNKLFRYISNPINFCFVVSFFSSL